MAAAAGTAVVSSPRTVLLVNPTMASRASARFPLAVLSLSAALDGKYNSTLIDGNVDRDFIATTLRHLQHEPIGAVGVSVMGGPQLRTAIALSRAVRERFPALPIVWGGAFPTNCPQATLSVEYVDYAVRSQGEQTFLELLDALSRGDSSALPRIEGLSWHGEGGVIHNPDRAFSAASLGHRLPYERLENPRRYLPRTCLGERTAGYQAALGCRFRCTFCGVAATFKGKTALPTAARLEEDLTFLTRTLGADAIQFYDHNFFDRETDMAPLLEILARFQVPWWCYARADALVNLSERSWALVRRSRLRMAYIGAESPSDWLLKDIRKGTRSDQTLEAVEVCRRNGVTPELSFMLAPPRDPEGETEKTFEFIRLLKRRHPEAEIMIYLYTPLPPAPRSTNPHAIRTARSLVDLHGQPVVFPRTADGWAEPRWHAYWCHKDAPWVSRQLHRRIRDFTTVLGCRFPTVIDVAAPRWQKTAMRLLASWRYQFRRYDRPWELELSRKLVRLRDPRALSL